MRNWTRIAITGSAALLTLSSAAAIAFPRTSFWHRTAAGSAAGASEGEGNVVSKDIFYTGGAQDFNLTCANCHIKGTNPQGLIGITIVPSPAWQNVNNQKGYKPNQQYSITVNMTGEHLGNTGASDNNNGITLTVENAAGALTGILGSDTQGVPSPCPTMFPIPEPVNTTTYLLGDCHALVSTETGNGRTQWKFTWKAPAAGKGTLTMFYGAVDGAHLSTDCLNDDVVVGNIKIVEGT